MFILSAVTLSIVHVVDRITSSDSFIEGISSLASPSRRTCATYLSSSAFFFPHQAAWHVVVEAENPRGYRGAAVAGAGISGRLHPREDDPRLRLA